MKSPFDAESDIKTSVMLSEKGAKDEMNFQSGLVSQSEINGSTVIEN